MIPLSTSEQPSADGDDEVDDDEVDDYGDHEMQERGLMTE